MLKFWFLQYGFYAHFDTEAAKQQKTELDHLIIRSANES